MKLKNKVIKDITNVIFKNDIELNEGSDFYLSHVIDDLFCVFTKKEFGSIFKPDCSPDLNVFFSNLGDMLLSNNLSGKGCFDYENSEPNRFLCLKDKINNYLNFKTNFILIKYSLNCIKPVSFFTISNGYIWTVCTNFNDRNRGYMGKLFKHFIKLIKRGEINDSDNINVNNNNLQLYLLKKNPNFDKTKEFYEECGFILKTDNFDKIIMETVI